MDTSKHLIHCKNSVGKPEDGKPYVWSEEKQQWEVWTG